LARNIRICKDLPPIDAGATLVLRSRTRHQRLFLVLALGANWLNLPPMETFLNLVWLLLVIVALCVWQRRWVRQKHASRRNPLQEWTAFACVMVLMFYVVSMTDDLHPEILLCDGCSTGRRTALVRPPAQRPSIKGHVPSSRSAAILPRVDSPNPLSTAGVIVPSSQAAILFFARDRSIARAPPIAL
jgi:hypothetical protein